MPELRCLVLDRAVDPVLARCIDSPRLHRAHLTWTHTRQSLQFNHGPNTPPYKRADRVDSIVGNRPHRLRLAHTSPASSKALYGDESVVLVRRQQFSGHPPLDDLSNAADL